MDTDDRNWYECVDPYIDTFYKMLRTRQLNEAERVIAQLRELQDSRYLTWSEYFSGILAEEHDRNWADAERYFLNLLNTNIDQVLRAHILLSLGVTYNNQARWPESVRACEESAAIWKALGYKIKHAYVLRQIAFSLQSGYRMGEFGPEVLERAISLCKIALTTFDSYDPKRPEIVLYEPDPKQYESLTLIVLGNLLGDSGQWDSAVTCYEYMLDLCTRRNDHYLKAFALRGLGVSHQMQGNMNAHQIHAIYQESLSIFQETKDFFKALSVHAHQGTLYQSTGNLKEAIQCYGQALDLVEQVRGNVTSEPARMGFSATVTHIYGNAILALLNLPDFAKAFNYIERARSRTFLDNLLSGPKDLAKTSIEEIVALDAIQTRLSQDAVILEYFTTGLLTAHGKRISTELAANDVLFPTSRTLLFVITNKSVEVHDANLSPNALVSSEPARAIEGYFLDLQFRQALYDKLITPIAHLLKNKHRLYIIPHGPLHYVPFHALIAPDGDALLRDGGPEIVYAPSATILFRELQKKSKPAPGACLAVGYNGEAGMELHFAEEEASYISRMTNGTALVGPFSKKAALYQQAPNYRAVHFSCHGEFDPDSPLDSLLHIGPGETLTSQEIMDNLRLNCELVTLSACESGLSKVQRGDELYGLIRAFMYAGAPAIIATLWRVDERSTLI